MNQFKKDPMYFLSYYFNSSIIFLFLNVFLAAGINVNLDFNISYLTVFIVVTGLIFGLQVATAFHNSSHFNFRPKQLNLIISELCGAYTLIGMRAFRVGHLLHHIHTDDPELDPHPPKGLTFIQFILTSHDKTIEVLKREYFKHHGEGPAAKRNILLQQISFRASFLLKILFWFQLFGLESFIFFYIPSYLAYFFGFAHLNYISHLPGSDGRLLIKNHSEGLFYKCMNLLTSGGYYHHNHHKFPGLRNPSKAQA